MVPIVVPVAGKEPWNLHSAIDAWRGAPETAQAGPAAAAEALAKERVDISNLAYSR